jgi:hypothetical protein
VSAKNDDSDLGQIWQDSQKEVQEASDKRARSKRAFQVYKKLGELHEISAGELHRIRELSGDDFEEEVKQSLLPNVVIYHGASTPAVKLIRRKNLPAQPVWKFFVKVLTEQNRYPVVVFRIKDWGEWVITTRQGSNFQVLSPRILVPAHEDLDSVYILPLEIYIQENKA